MNETWYGEIDPMKHINDLSRKTGVKVITDAFFGVQMVKFLVEEIMSEDGFIEA
jgi:glutamate/tyrosine decarboxylase-like PLP-dependent enzyme